MQRISYIDYTFINEYLFVNISLQRYLTSGLAGGAVKG
jgi:hypothetical protein